MHRLSSIVRLPVIGAVVLLTGCATAPPRYQAPVRLFEQPRVERVTLSSISAAKYEVTDGLLVDDAGALKWALEDTGCFGQVVPATRPDHGLHIKGEAHGERRHGVARTAVRVVETVTLLRYLGVPLPGAADGRARARLYRDGALVKELAVSSRVGYWTPLRTHVGADRRGVAAARFKALRALADAIAADVCGNGRPAAGPRRS